MGSGKRTRNRYLIMNHSVKSSQPVGEDKYAFVQRLKEFLYSFFHALPINSFHKPLISIKIEFLSNASASPTWGAKLASHDFLCKVSNKNRELQKYGVPNRFWKPGEEKKILWWQMISHTK